MDLTKRQQEIFDFIKRYSATNGYPPTVRDIGKAVGLASSSTVHAHLANLALCEWVIAVVTSLGRQIERHREAGLPLREIGAIKRVGCRGARMAGIGAEDPGLIAAHTGQATQLLLRCKI